MPDGNRDPNTWGSRDYNAIHAWLCGRCGTELQPGTECLECETCGSRYEHDTGVPLHLVDREG